MSLDFVTLDHNCNVVRREIEEEFHKLSLLFIPHAPGERRKSFVDKRSLIQAKIHGRKLYDIISMSNALENDQSEFMGIVVNSAHQFNLLGRKHYTAVFFLNIADPLFQEGGKQPIYHLAWHALSLYQRISGYTTHKKKRSKDLTKIIKPRFNDLKQARNNLMADIFSVILTEADSANGMIESLAKSRSILTLNKTKGYLAENYPYPLAYEACRLLYDDFKNIRPARQRALHQALDLTQEVAFTFQEDSILQWWEFARNAQEMAWNDHSPPDILGNAIYTSDNTDVRALAYQIAELLEIEPSSQNPNQGEYNPFASERSNRRARDSQCEDIFSRLISIAALQNDTQIFENEISRQNAALLNGVVQSWCAPALSAAANAFDQSLHAQGEEAEKHPSEVAADSFYATQKITFAETLQELSHCILTLRRFHETPNMEQLIKALAKRPDMHAIADFLSDNSSVTKSFSSEQSAAMREDLMHDDEDYSDEADFIRARLSKDDRNEP